MALNRKPVPTSSVITSDLEPATPTPKRPKSSVSLLGAEPKTPISSFESSSSSSTEFGAPTPELVSLEDGKLDDPFWEQRSEHSQPRNRSPHPIMFKDPNWVSKHDSAGIVS